jgi:hypothetical protein
MEDVGIFYGHMVYLTAIWYILWPFFGYFYVFHILVCRTRKNPATLVRS